jgi:hypothetical protein
MGLTAERAFFVLRRFDRYSIHSREVDNELEPGSRSCMNLFSVPTACSAVRR